MVCHLSNSLLLFRKYLVLTTLFLSLVGSFNKEPILSLDNHIYSSDVAIDSLVNDQHINKEIQELKLTEEEYYDSNDPNPSLTSNKSFFNSIDGHKFGGFTSESISGENEVNQSSLKKASNDIIITTWDEIYRACGIGNIFKEKAYFETSADSRIKISNENINMIIGFNHSLYNNEKTQDILFPFNYKIEKIIKKLNAMVISIPISSLRDFIELSVSLKEIRYIEPSLIYSIDSTPNDPNWSAQWGPQRIKTDLAWNIQKGNPSSVLVAVIDTGIDYTHPDLSAQYVDLGYDWVNDDNDPKDDHSHGTHCAGIIAATINNSLGIAGTANVQIMAEKFLNVFGIGNNYDAANAIIHAVDAGADILSNSWGGSSQSNVLKDALAYAATNDVIIVAAAGNDASSTPSYPSTYPEVISVSATDINDNLASFSNFGDTIEIAAPGIDIYSTVLSGSYDNKSGTSMACPHVSGVLALIRSEFPSWTAEQVRSHLRDRTDDLGVPGWDQYYGYGLLNAYKAVQPPPLHNLKVFLEAPSGILPGTSTLVNVSVFNGGRENETSVKVELWINDSIAHYVTFTEIVNWTSVSFSYNWEPIEEGVYNVTAFIQPVEDENSTLDNIAHKEVITTSKMIVYISSHGERPLQGLKNFYMNELDYFVKEISSPITADSIISYPIVLVGEGGEDWTTSEITAIEDYMQNGGVLVAIGDSLPPDGPTQIAASYGITFTDSSIGSSGPTTFIDLFHPLMEKVTSIYIPSHYNALEVTSPALPIFWDSTGEGIYGAVVEVGSGFLCVLADDFDQYITNQDNEIMFANILSLPNYQPPEHDLTVYLKTPKIQPPDETGELYTTLYNRGLENETEILLQLMINETLVTSHLYSSIFTRTKEIFIHQWTPTTPGIYNITVYVVPVISESIILNNNATKLVQVPDIYNYKMNDTIIYNWIDTTSGTILPLDDDDSEAVELPFLFHMYGQAFSDVYVSSNGWLSFYNTDPIAEVSSEFPSTNSDHYYAIALFWDDLDPSNNIFTLTLTNPNRFIIEYHNMDHFGSEGHAGSFQVILYETGEIIFQYDYIETVGNPTIGLNYGINQNYYNVYYGLTSSTNDLAILFTYVKPDHEIVTTLEAPSVIRYGDSVTLNATVSNLGLKNETNVELQLWINDTLAINRIYPSLLSGTTETLNYLWMPTEIGIYDVTAYTVPIINETYVKNNRMIEVITVGEPIINFNLGSYIDLEIEGVTWTNFTYVDIFDSIHVFVDMSTGEWLSVNTISRLIEDGSIWVGTYYIGQIETDIGIGDTINWFDTTGVVVGTVLYNWYGYVLEAWNISIDLYQDYVYYHKENGILLYYNTNGSEIHLVDTNMVIWQPPDHDLAVSLESPEALQLNEAVMLNVTVQNRGLSTETNVELQLWIDGNLVNNQTYPSLQTGATETLNYIWIPTEFGNFNITVYALPMIDEIFLKNNRAINTILVFTNYNILIDQGHGTDSILNYSIWTSSLITTGHIIDVITSNLTSSLLEGYDILVIPQARITFYSSEIIAIQTFVENGGGLFVIGDDHPSIYTDLTSFTGISWINGGFNGTTIDITPHPVTKGVSSVFFGSSLSELSIKGSAQSLIRINGITELAVSSYYNGRVAGVGDENTILDRDIDQAENSILFTNLISWLGLGKARKHDLALFLEVPTVQPLNKPTILNVTIYNQGLNYETDIELQLWINNTLIINQSGFSLLSGIAEKLSCTWTPVEIGTYNVTVYTAPVTNETFVSNNRIVEIITVGDSIINFYLGDYIDLYTEELQWTNFTYVDYIDSSHVYVEMGIGEWLSVNIITRLVEDGSIWKGTYYIGQIKTDGVEVEDTINWFDTTGTIIGTVWYDWDGYLLEAWNISVKSWGAYVYYHKETGIWLYYNNNGLEIYLSSTNMVIWQPYEINFLSPSNGTTVSGSHVFIEYNTTVSFNIASIEVYVNDEYVTQINPLLNESSTLYVPVFQGGTNIISLEAIWKGGKTAVASIEIDSVDVIPIIEPNNGDYFNWRYTTDDDRIYDFNFTFIEWLSPIEINISLLVHRFYNSNGSTYELTEHWLVMNILNGYISSSDMWWIDKHLYFFTRLEDPAAVNIGDTIPLWMWNDIGVITGTSMWNGYEIWIITNFNDQSYIGSILQSNGLFVQYTDVFAGNILDSSFLPILDTTPPTLTRPDDITCEEGDTGNNISWTATDLNPGNYTLYREDVVIKTDSWSSNDLIVINVDGHSVGSYNYSIEVYDSYDNPTTDTV
ncbi:MAG: S8 family serine peptidase, partial [Candidatus Hodarchaeales archaeon]